MVDARKVNLSLVGLESALVMWEHAGQPAAFPHLIGPLPARRHARQDRACIHGVEAIRKRLGSIY